jgi:hypothetical protein
MYNFGYRYCKRAQQFEECHLKMLDLIFEPGSGALCGKRSLVVTKGIAQCVKEFLVPTPRICAPCVVWFVCVCICSVRVRIYRVGGWTLRKQELQMLKLLLNLD